MHRYDPIRVFIYTPQAIPIPMRVLRALVSQPLILLDQAGQFENAAYMQWVALFIQSQNADHLRQNNLLTLSVLRLANSQKCSSDWQLRLLLSVPAGGGGATPSVAGGQDPVLRRPSWCHQGGWCKVTVSFLLPPLQPPPISRTIKQWAHSGWRVQTPFGHPV